MGIFKNLSDKYIFNHVQECGHCVRTCECNKEQPDGIVLGPKFAVGYALVVLVAMYFSCFG